MTTAAAQPTSSCAERDVLLRLGDFYEIHTRADDSAVRREAGRCMNCGAAFCQPSGGYRTVTGAPAGCPIDNRIPEWNALAHAGQWREAYDRLALTNNFPEFTSRLCPAPCQSACIHGLNERPVGIKSIEYAITERAFDAGWVIPNTPTRRTDKRIAIIGSGPAGLAAADQLNKAGHHVTVYERADRPGGLLMYGIPNMKLDKALLQRRLDLMQQAGITFVTGVDVGTDLDPDELVETSDAVIVACGALDARDLQIPGRHLRGIHLAMDYLESATRDHLRDAAASNGRRITAEGKDVLVIGGGDTGADCVGTALRQGCRSIRHLARASRPPTSRPRDTPWPSPAHLYHLDYAHAEGRARFGDDPRGYRLQPVAFIPSTSHTGVGGVKMLDLDADAHVTFPADLVLLAIGFHGTDAHPLLRSLALPMADGRITIDAMTRQTARPGVFAAGDCHLGSSLVVHAIAQGRATAARVDQHVRTAS